MSKIQKVRGGTQSRWLLEKHVDLGRQGECRRRRDRPGVRKYMEAPVRVRMLQRSTGRLNITSFNVNLNSPSFRSVRPSSYTPNLPHHVPDRIKLRCDVHLQDLSSIAPYQSMATLDDNGAHSECFVTYPQFSLPKNSYIGS